MLGSTQQVARVLFEQLGLTAGRKGKTGLLDRREGAALDPRRARDRAGDRGVARALEAAQHLPRPAADADRRDDRAAAHDDQPDGRLDRAALDDEPEPAVDPDPHRARARDPLRVHRRGRREAALGRLLADRAAHPRAPLGRAEAARGVRARRGHPPRDRRRGARQGPGDAHDRRALDREDDQLRDRLRHLGLRPLGEPRDPARGGAGLHRRLPRALPARPGLHRAHDRAGGARRLRDDAARPPAARCPSSASRNRQIAVGRASGSRSTSRCRARTPTSSRWR